MCLTPLFKVWRAAATWPCTQDWLQAWWRSCFSSSPSPCIEGARASTALMSSTPLPSLADSSPSVSRPPVKVSQAPETLEFPSKMADLASRNCIQKHSQLIQMKDHADNDRIPSLERKYFLLPIFKGPPGMFGDWRGLFSDCHQPPESHQSCCLGSSGGPFLFSLHSTSICLFCIEFLFINVFSLCPLSLSLTPLHTTSHRLHITCPCEYWAAPKTQIRLLKLSGKGHSGKCLF